MTTTTNDRELLELAAKAGGVEQCRTDSGEVFYHSGRDHPWDPLTDDGDALRLAVELRIDIEHDDRAGPDETWVSASMQGIHVMEDYRSRASRLQATRRAIVRAAAEIGRTMT